MDNKIRDKALLEAQFGFSCFYDSVPKLGWLLNYHIEKNYYNEVSVSLYFVDENTKNFKIILPYYPTFLVECPRNGLSDVEEYFMKKYEGKIRSTESVHRNDVTEHNHLNKPPKNFVKIYVRTESDFLQIIKDHIYQMKDEEDNIYDQYAVDGDKTIYRLYEYDIPLEVQVANAFNIRCGAWYDVKYNGSKYKLTRNARVVYPDLRIMAYDIETTKPPLKFPNAKK